MDMSFSRFAFTASLMILCAGCDGGAVVGTINEPVPTVDTTSGVPRLQAGEKIKVTVFGEPNLSGDYLIDPGGFVSLPLAGTVKAGGRTKLELELELAKKFRGEFLRNPKVTVDVAEFRPYYVLGEVAKPGEYPYKSGLTVMSALAVAGGQTYRASNSTVMLQRAGESAMREYSINTNLPVYPGDLIRLPQRYF
jgi:protein involved in polysaccharide export with SLBB domain